MHQDERDKIAVTVKQKGNEDKRGDIDINDLYSRKKSEIV